jgi:hypothetical protein
MDKFSSLLVDLQATNKISYVFLETNINILNLAQPEVINYLNCIFEGGYLQLISKATRIQNESKTLIDHVLSRSGALTYARAQ